jgi:enoyl-CoA hydratase/carnithine racemase
MSFEVLSLLEEKGVLYIKLNRPEKRNAITPQMLDELDRCITEVATKDSVGAVVLSGEGKAFSAGMDLTELGKVAGTSSQDFRRSLRKFQRAFSEIEYLEKAVIAAIHGYAIGAGFEMALACDLRIASQETAFTIPEVNVGIIPDLGGSQRLPKIIGVGRAKELILTGKTISALDAERIGLVNKVVPLEDLQNTARAWAEDIISNGPLAVGLAKRNIDTSFGLSISEGLEAAGITQSLLISSYDFQEGVKARAGKRKANFKKR